MPNDQSVKLVHPDRAAFTRALAFADTCRAGVVAVIDAVLGGRRAKGHPTPAGGAHRQTRQQDRAGCNARCDSLRTAGMKLALNLLEHLRLDQAGHRYRDDLLFRLALPRARGGLIELPLADVDRVGQDPVNAGNPKGVAAPGAIATAVEPFDPSFYPHRARPPIPLHIHPETYHTGLAFAF